MFENIMKFFNKFNKKKDNKSTNSREAAKERLHLVLMQDRANVSADFLELMKQEIIEVIKKYIDVDESAIDVRLTNKENEDGSNGAPALYANIPIINIKNEARKVEKQEVKTNKEESKEDKKENEVENKANEEKQSKKQEEVVEKVRKIEEIKEKKQEEDTGTEKREENEEKNIPEESKNTKEEMKSNN